MVSEAPRPYDAYDDFAWFYHRYWSRGIPFRLLDAVERLLLARLPPGTHVVDLCCGTGRVARAIASRGFRVTGIDGSATMLAIAREEAPEVTFVHADARAFALAEPASAIVSMFDSLNHVTEAADLARVFACARKELVPGGRFVFDLNDEVAFRTHWTGQSFTTVEPDHVSILRGTYDARVRLGRVDVTMFREVDGAWRRADTTVHERCYAPDDVLAMLSRAGFRAEVVRAEDDLGMADQEGRLFFVAE